MVELDCPLKEAQNNSSGSINNAEVKKNSSLNITMLGTWQLYTIQPVCYCQDYCEIPAVDIISAAQVVWSLKWEQIR